MVFSSNIFLFAFLPLFLLYYYLVPARARSALILAFSYAFYIYETPAERFGQSVASTG